MHPLRVLLPVMLLFGLPAVAAPRQAARPSAAFDAPPYLAVSNGLNPELQALPGNLPVLKAGALVAFEVCTGAGTNFLFCDRPLAFPVNSASQDFAMASEVLNGRIEVQKASATIFRSQSTGAVSLVSDSKSLATARQTGTIQTAQAALSLSQTNRQMVVATAQATKELWRNDVQETVPSAVQIERTPEAARHAGDTASARVTNLPMTRSQETAGAPLVGEADTRAITGSQAGGRLGSLLDADGVRALADSDYIRLLTDQNLIDGIYDAANVPMAPAMQVPEEELALLAGMLNLKPTLASLLDRPCSAGLRAQAATNSAAPCEATVSLAVLGADAYQHGGKALLSLELKNTGAAPLYDALILNRLPEHTTFSRFLVPDPLKRGFVHIYAPDLSLLVWKLYSPLQPGATFKATVLLDLEAWRVPVKSSHWWQATASRAP